MRKYWTPAVAGALMFTVSLGGCAGNGIQSSSEVSTLENYLSAISEGNTAERDYEAQERKREDLLSQCMASEGFTYVPQTFSAAEDTEPGEADWSTLEFAEEYGYGTVDWPGKDEAEPEEDPSENLNSEYTQKLSPSDLQAYQKALYGSKTSAFEDFEAGDLPEYDWTTSGCSGSSYHEVYGAEDAADQAQWDDPDYVSLVEDVGTLYAALATGSNPDVAALDDEWVVCMKDSGFLGMVSRYEAQQAFDDQYFTLTQNQSDDEESLQSELSELQAQEIKQAVADWKCADKIGYNQRYQEIKLAAENQFVADNKNRLESLLLRYSDQK